MTRPGLALVPVSLLFACGTLEQDESDGGSLGSETVESAGDGDGDPSGDGDGDDEPPGPASLLTATQARPEGLAVSSTEVFWAEVPFGVFRYPLAGGNIQEFADGDRPYAVEVVDDTVFWTDAGPSPGEGTVRSKPIAMGSWVTHAFTQDEPGDVTVDATHVYWTYGSPGSGSAGVRRAPRAAWAKSSSWARATTRRAWPWRPTSWSGSAAPR